MSWMDALRQGIATLDKVTKPGQSTVQHDVFTGDKGKGDVSYTRVERIAIVDKRQKQVRTAEGVLTVSGATVIFLDPTITVTTNDLIFLADGTGGPVLAIAGFMDPITKKTVISEVYL